MIRPAMFSAHGVIGRSHRRSRPRAFTLLETLFALVVIGVGVLAFVDAQSAFTQSNNWSSHSATGMLLANEVREMTRNLPRHDPVTGLTLVDNGGVATLTGWGRETGEVTIDDIDDLDDLDGLSFGSGGTFQGPIDALGDPVPAVNLDGTIVLENGLEVALPGWTQRVTVTKVDPYNCNTVRDDAYEQPASAQWPFIRVDKFPVRVTVVVEYQGIGDTQAAEVTRLTWVVR